MSFVTYVIPRVSLVFALSKNTRHPEWPALLMGLSTFTFLLLERLHCLWNPVHQAPVLLLKTVKPEEVSELAASVGSTPAPVGSDEPSDQFEPPCPEPESPVGLWWCIPVLVPPVSPAPVLEPPALPVGSPTPLDEVPVPVSPEPSPLVVLFELLLEPSEKLQLPVSTPNDKSPNFWNRAWVRSKPPMLVVSGFDERKAGQAHLQGIQDTKNSQKNAQ